MELWGIEDVEYQDIGNARSYCLFRPCSHFGRHTLCVQMFNSKCNKACVIECTRSTSDMGVLVLLMYFILLALKWEFIGC